MPTFAQQFHPLCVMRLALLTTKRHKSNGLWSPDNFWGKNGFTVLAPLKGNLPGLGALSYSPSPFKGE